MLRVDIRNTRTVAYMQGVLNIDKPAGITSHDVVDFVRKITGERQVGHGGTLDPFATGVLVVAVGNATRLLEYAHDLPKTYRSTFILGATSDTDDETGIISKSKFQNPKQLTKSKITNALKQFIGTIEQVPPAYSAVKVKGKKLYELARAGKLIQAKPRQVVVHDINVLSYAYPRLELEITCGSGTYIRAIARDLGEKLGTGAYVEELRRTAIGPFTIGQVVPLDTLTKNTFSQYALPPKMLVAHLPHLTLNDTQVSDFKQGKTVPISRGQTPPNLPLSGEELAAVFDSDSTLIGIGMISEGVLKPHKVL